MKNICFIPIGNIGYYREAGDHNQALIQKLVSQAFVTNHPDFKWDMFQSKIVHKNIDFDIDLFLPFVAYDCKYVELFNTPKNDIYCREYHRWIDWISTMQQTYVLHQLELFAVCEAIENGTTNIKIVRTAFEDGNFNIISIDYGNEDYFKKLKKHRK